MLHSPHNRECNDCSRTASLSPTNPPLVAINRCYEPKHTEITEQTKLLVFKSVHTVVSVTALAKHPPVLDSSGAIIAAIVLIVLACMSSINL